MRLRYLLDTHVLIWLSMDLSRIPTHILLALKSTNCDVFVSTVSYWELAIKQRLGKLQSNVRLQDAVGARGISELTISSNYTDVIRDLPLLHGDPFDRMIVAQAMVEGMVLVTGDRRLWEYPVTTLRV